MSDLKTPPPRPSTAHVTTPPMAALRGMPRPRVVTISFWCWMLAGLLAAGTVVLLATKIDPMLAEFARLARISDPEASQATIDQVAAVSVLLVLGAAALFGLLGVGFAAAMRSGSNGARLVLALLALPAVGYGSYLAIAATDAMLGPTRATITYVLLGYTAAVLTAAVCLFLPGARRWFHRPR